jgi:hypothetical protein
MLRDEIENKIQLRKMIQNKINIIKKMMIKFDIKIKLNKILKDKIENKIN